jgi:competence protein ComEA
MVLALLLAPLCAQAAPPAAPDAGQVNINTATADELMALPGIGPAKARAIVEYRTQKPFKAPEDLLRVRGIGKGIFKGIRELITVTGPTTFKGARPAGRQAR